MDKFEINELFSLDGDDIFSSSINDGKNRFFYGEIVKKNDYLYGIINIKNYQIISRIENNKNGLFDDVVELKKCLSDTIKLIFYYNILKTKLPFCKHRCYKFNISLN